MAIVALRATGSAFGADFHFCGLTDTQTDRQTFRTKIMTKVDAVALPPPLAPSLVIFGFGGYNISFYSDPFCRHLRHFCRNWIKQTLLNSEMKDDFQSHYQNYKLLKLESPIIKVVCCHFSAAKGYFFLEGC